MTAAIHDADVERFRAAICARIGLYFDDANMPFLAEVLRRRIAACHQSTHAYLSGLETERCTEELGALAWELTVPETYFFRNVDQYRALKDVALPDCLARRVGGHLVMASLGCASGEEPYSLAMMARDLLGPAARDISILGVDLNPAVLAKARRGRFSPWALRETSEADRQRWFRREGREFVIDADVCAAVRFEQQNLVDDDCLFWRSDAYDIVFCRNVMMYFAPDQARTLIARIVRALRPGGYLFMGHAETLRGLSTDVHLRHTHNTFYYQRTDHLSGRPVPPNMFDSLSASHLATGAIGVGEARTWMESIRRASERVTSLTESRRADGRSRIGAEPDSPVRALSLVCELLERERFAEALAVVDALPPESDRDGDTLLLRAVLLVHSGQFEEAEDACLRLLEIDGVGAAAHYLLALCREAASDMAAAVHHDQLAAYLDPGFAMPRLHLGLVARRAGNRFAARRELGHALVLLQREDAARVLLFGGGFGRRALVRLCGAELVECGGSRD